MKTLFLTAVVSLASIISHGQVVQDFTLRNVLNDEDVSLKTYPSCSGVVVIFTSNSCPFDEHYRERIKRLSAQYQDRVPVLLVNSNQEPAESADNMKKKAQQWKFGVPYLADKDQVLMQRLGATKSPHAFLLKNTGGRFTVVYNGAIDDNAQVEGDVHHSYLKDAIDILLSNQSIATPEIRPTGCSIRRK